MLRLSHPGRRGLAGCATRGPAGLDLDTSVNAVSQSSRVRAIVIHYTTEDDARSMQLLSKGKVSAHYLLSPEGRAHRLVDETRAAWHAGNSSWYGITAMNSTSIGIELVNPGWTQGADGGRVWHAYDDRQIRALTILLRDLIQRHGVAPENVVGHSDIAPQRRWIPARCSRGSSWRPPASAAGTTKPARRRSLRACRPSRCPRPHGSSSSCNAWLRQPANGHAGPRHHQRAGGLPDALPPGAL